MGGCATTRKFIRMTTELLTLPEAAERLSVSPRTARPATALDMPKPDPIKILSLGVGVQSTTIALMSAHGEIEMMDCAIFADTQAEPKAVYDQLDWLVKQLPYPVYKVSKGNLYKDSLTVRTTIKHNRKVLANKIPAFVKNPDGTVGLFGRKCTADYKVAVIEREVRRLLGINRFSKKQPVLVHQYIGISMDEAVRQKPSKRAAIKNVYPLLDLDMTRHDCLEWVRSHGYPEPPKSACMFCPFHSDAMWLEIQKNPIEWEQVIQFERALQAGAAADDVTRGTPYLHRDCVPIDQVNFRPKTNLKMHQRDLFGNECEGLCGV